MNDTGPPIPNRQRTIDADHLILLSIFHFVGAGLALLATLFLLAHFAMFHAFFANPQMWQNQKEGPPPQQVFEVFSMFKWFYLIFGFWTVSSAILNVISGLCLRARKQRVFSMFVGAVNCLHVPLGTVLGIFTITVLLRPSVRELYEAPSAAGGLAQYK